MKGKQKDHYHQHHDPIDLALLTREAKEEEKVYICSQCSRPLIHDPLYRLKINPYGGEAYYCNNINKCSLFGKMIDSSLVKLSRAARQVRSTIGSERDSQMDFIVDTVSENKGLQPPEDEYEKYNPEPMEDERLEMEGAYIINSTTYYPASNTTITKKSQTPAEIAEEKGYHNFIEPY